MFNLEQIRKKYRSMRRDAQQKYFAQLKELQLTDGASSPRDIEIVVSATRTHETNMLLTEICSSLESKWSHIYDRHSFVVILNIFSRIFFIP